LAQISGPDFSREALGGSDDNDDMAETLASLKSSELLNKAKIGEVAVTSDNF
tara:strand:+ start:174 stop:329 length:156 start_codon:yes stop_codon:yes gene_type:complete